jgi:dCMP deaminase
MTSVITKNLSKWDQRYIELAKQISTWSKDPSRKIGAVAVGAKGQILSQGYNGFPRGILDLPERYENRDVKYKHVVHAEMNVIYNATFNGVSLDGASLFVYGLPVCNECAKGIIQVGIQRVVIYTDDAVPDIWTQSFELTWNMFKEAGIKSTWVQT